MASSISTFLLPSAISYPIPNCASHHGPVENDANENPVKMKMVRISWQKECLWWVGGILNWHLAPSLFSMAANCPALHSPIGRMLGLCLKIAAHNLR